MTFAEFGYLFMGLTVGACIGLVTFGLLGMAKSNDDELDT
jgi:hypothetical protein